MVKRHGSLSIDRAIRDHLPGPLNRTGADHKRLDELLSRISDVVGWITTAELDAVVTAQRPKLNVNDTSVRGTVERLAAAVSAAIATHS